MVVLHPLWFKFYKKCCHLFLVSAVEFISNKKFFPNGKLQIILNSTMLQFVVLIALNLDPIMTCDETSRDEGLAANLNKNGSPKLF